MEGITNDKAEAMKKLMEVMSQLRGGPAASGMLGAMQGQPPAPTQNITLDLRSATVCLAAITMLHPQDLNQLSDTDIEKAARLAKKLGTELFGPMPMDCENCDEYGEGTYAEEETE